MLLFYFFITALFFSVYKTVTCNYAVYSIFYLIFAFCSAASIFILFELEFISLLIILIYVGAIAVLFIFVIIILNVQNQDAKKENKKINFEIFVMAFFFSTSLFFQDKIFKSFVVFQENIIYFNWYSFFDKNNAIQAVGKVLFSYYTVTFLVAGLLLLAAIIIAVILTINTTKKNTELFSNQKNFYQISRSSKNVFFKIKK